MKITRQNLIQAYQTAPWRVQMQLIVAFSVTVVVTGLIAGIYLNVTARTAAIGREIQAMQYDILEIQRENSDYESQLAALTSATAMEQRAAEMGFRSLSPVQVIYLEVPGYAGRQEVVKAPPPRIAVTQADELPIEFTQTLFDWLRTFSLSSPDNLAQVIP